MGGSGESLWSTVRGDFAAAPGRRVVAVAGVLLWMAFQWGWGNDILLPPITATAFDAVDDGSTWLSGVGAVAWATTAGGLFWALTQTLDGIIVLSGLRLLPGITARISDFLRRQDWMRPYDEISLGTRFLIAYMSGASVLCLVDVFATGQQGLRMRRRMLAEAVGLAVAGVALAILVVTTFAAIGTRVPASRSTAETVVRYASNPLTWLVIYGSLVGISALISKLRGDAGETGDSGDTGQGAQDSLPNDGYDAAG